MIEMIRILIKNVARVAPQLAVVIVLGHVISAQGKRMIKREEEQKKGIYRSHYIVKSEKILLIVFVMDFLLFGVGMVFSAMDGEKLVAVFFGAFSAVGAAGSLNMSIWKLEINGDEITWRSTFGKKRKFTFDDIIYIEYRRQSKRLCIDGEEPFTITIDNNIDDAELMEDIKRRRLPVHSLKLRDNWLKKKNKKRR